MTDTDAATGDDVRRADAGSAGEPRTGARVRWSLVHTETSATPPARPTANRGSAVIDDDRHHDGSVRTDGPVGTAEGSQQLMETLVAAVDHAFDAIMITDADLAEPGPRIVYVNAALCRMTGYAAEELIGRTPRILQGPRTDRRVMERLRADLLREGTFQGQAVNYRRDGSTFTMEWSISTLRDAAGDARFHVAVQRDVTTFRRLLANAERQARTDPLTGLDNRRAFDARLTAVLANRRVRDRVGLIALDIDHFKSVNDAHGHATGDLVLQEVARRVRRAVGRRGTVARTGGEEMAVILVDAPDLAAVADLADRVRVAIAASPVEVVSGRLPVTASLGVAHATAGGRGAEALAACADRALYRSKADGRNRVTSAMPWTEAHARAS